MVKIEKNINSKNRIIYNNLHIPNRREENRNKNL